MVKINIKPFNEKMSFNIPAAGTVHAAGFDLCASIADEGEIKLIPAHIASDTKGNLRFAPPEVKLVPTNLVIELPPGYEAQIRPRSGLALKYGVTMVNNPGTIDADYRGEICVIMHNLGDSVFTIKDGDRIAQMVIAKHEIPDFVTGEELSETERGENGFGSTGTKLKVW